MNRERRGSDPFRRERRKRAQNVIGVQAGAMEGVGNEEWVVGAGPFAGGGGTLRQENREVMNLAHILAVSSWFDPVVKGWGDDVVNAVRRGVDLQLGH